jgi:hypothetical protein
MELKWRKSSRSSPNGGNCVEIALDSRVIAARDSKNPAGGILWFSPGEWQRFLIAVKAGRLDI